MSKNKKGLFSIIHENQVLKVMFLNDYVVQYNCTRYALKKKVISGEIKRLFIKGRKRLNSVIVISKMKLKIESNFISDDSGKFTILHEGKKKQVMFVNDFAKITNSSKQLVFHHIDSEFSKKEHLSKVTIERFASERDVVFVAIEK